MKKPEPILYEATAVSTGGRNGTSSTPDGRVSLKLSVPKGLGGDDGPGTNPEQLFASGYSACFIGAMQFVAGKEKVKLPEKLSVEAKVGIGPIPEGFTINVNMKVNVPGLDLATAKALVDKAHGVCPYSNATRGNIEVKFEVLN